MPLNLTFLMISMILLEKLKIILRMLMTKSKMVQKMLMIPSKKLDKMLLILSMAPTPSTEIFLSASL